MSIEADFEALPLAAIADAALTRASELGAEHADVRICRQRHSYTSVRDGKPENVADDLTLGIGVRVIVDGSWGFASAEVISIAAAAGLAERAVALARQTAPMNLVRVSLAPEPTYQGRWESTLAIDPFTVPEAQRLDLLLGWSSRLLSSPSVQHVEAHAAASRDITYYADTSGTRTLQQRTRTNGTVTAVNVSDDGFEEMTSIAPPTARGWEYLTGTGWDWDREIDQLPDLLAEKVAAPSVEPGRYDLVIHPTNLWLTIHESIGHATELDRALGYEANYAGTSFATPDQLGTLKYGTPLMNVTGDRTAEFGLATAGWDDEGVAAQQWDIVREGILVGYQLDRATAALVGQERSNGCAFADSPHHVPMQRMPNVSLKPAPDGPDVDALIAGVEDGIYIVGDRSWSIDMQRYNFQFTGQQFHRIKGGRLVGQVKDVAYQSKTPDFWGSLVALGGPQTYLLGGALNCGKGQPGQTAPVSHGCPAAVFESVNVLNSVAEAGQ